MAAIYDFNIIQGDQFDARLTVTDSDGAMDLSGYAARGYVKNKYSDTGVLLDLSPVVVSGDLGSLYASGYVDIAVSGAQTQPLPITQGVFDVEIYKNTYVKKMVGFESADKCIALCASFDGCKGVNFCQRTCYLYGVEENSCNDCWKGRSDSNQGYCEYFEKDVGNVYQSFFLCYN